MTSATAPDHIVCRFCLQLTVKPEQELDSELCEFIQEILLVKINPNEMLICPECCLMWETIRDFLGTCLLANTILQASSTTKIPYRPGWERHKPLLELSKAIKTQHGELQALGSTPSKLIEVQTEIKQETDADTQSLPKAPLDSFATSRCSTKITKNKGIQFVEIAAQPGSNLNTSASDLSTREDICIFELREDAESATFEDTVLPEPSTPPEVESLSPGKPAAEAAAACERILKIRLSSGATGSTASDTTIDLTSKDEEWSGTMCQVCGVYADDMATHLKQHIVRREKQKRDVPAVVVIQLPNKKLKSQPPSQPKRRGRPPLELPKIVHTGPGVECNICGILLLNAQAEKNHSRMHQARRKRAERKIESL